MQRIVINACYGGFSLSKEAVLAYAEKKGITLYVEEKDPPFGLLGPTFYTVPPEQYHELHDRCYAEDGNYKRINETGWYFSDRGMPRDDPALVEVVEEIGSEAASGRFAELKVVDVPDGVEWRIEEYDGVEWVAERHQTWM